MFKWILRVELQIPTQTRSIRFPELQNPEENEFFIWAYGYMVFAQKLGCLV